MIITDSSLCPPDNLTNNNRGELLFDYEKLMAFAEAHAPSYKQADPFPNIIIDEFVNDDGISNRKEGGLSLKVEAEAVGKTGSWKVYAKIV